MVKPQQTMYSYDGQELTIRCPSCGLEIKVAVYDTNLQGIWESLMKPHILQCLTSINHGKFMVDTVAKAKPTTDSGKLVLSIADEYERHVRRTT